MRGHAVALIVTLCACTAGREPPARAPVAPALAAATPLPPPTIAHRLLALEHASLPGAEDVSATLDAVIDAATSRVRQASLAGTERERAIATLSLIARELDAQRFVYPGRGLVDTLHDGLADLLIDGSALTSLAQQEDNLANEERQRLLRDAVRARSTVFHVADCDVLSLLYLAVGERLDLPLAMIDLPESGDSYEHTYVVWTLSDGTIVSWEATTGAERTEPDDPHYATDGLFSRDSLVARRANGVPMTEDEVLGYWHRVIGSTLRNRGHDRRAAAAYREAIRLQPGSPVASQLLVWLLASSPDPRVRDGAEAITIARRLVADWPGPDHLYLLAGAYAAAGQWDDARSTQCRAIAQVRGLPDDDTCEGITIDPDDPTLGDWEQPLARYLRCQPFVAPRHAEWLAEAWRDYLGFVIWDELAIVAEPLPYVPLPDACPAAPSDSAPDAPAPP